MPTQLEMIIEALKAARKPLSADELGVFLKAAGSKAENPQNSVFSMVSLHPDLFVVVKDGGVVRYSLANGSQESLQGAVLTSGGTEVGGEDFSAFKTICKRMAKGCKFCASEADVREKLVLPFLQGFLGYDVVQDMSFEPSLNGEHKERPDIVVSKGRRRLFVVEIKRIGADLSKAEGQLKRYFRMADGSPAHVGILTDGLRWRFYLRETKGGVVEAVLYCSGLMDKPDMAFMDAAVDLKKDDFVLEIMKDNAKAAILENSPKKA